MFYGIIALVQCLLGIYLNVFELYTYEREIFAQNSINVFMIIEFAIFYQFLIVSINSKLMKLLMKLILTIFLGIVFYFWIFSNSFNESPVAFTVVEAYLILLSCLFYYYELFMSPSKNKLMDQSKFWIITGMLFLFSFIIPLFLQRNNLYWNFADLYRSIYSLTFVGYILLFSFFIYALKCQIKTT